MSSCCWCAGQGKAHLAVEGLDGLEDIAGGVWVVDERVSLRAVDELEVLGAWLAVDGLGHGGGGGGKKRVQQPMIECSAGEATLRFLLSPLRLPRPPAARSHARSRPCEQQQQLTMSARKTALASHPNRKSLAAAATLSPAANISKPSPPASRRPGSTAASRTPTRAASPSKSGRSKSPLSEHPDEAEAPPGSTAIALDLSTTTSELFESLEKLNKDEILQLFAKLFDEREQVRSIACTQRSTH